jgi:hypothetical protein
MKRKRKRELIIFIYKGFQKESIGYRTLATASRPGSTAKAMLRGDNISIVDYLFIICINMVPLTCNF